MRDPNLYLHPAQTGSGAIHDPLYDRKTAAAYLGLTNANTLAVWDCTKSHDLKPIKVGRSVRYRKSALDAWLLERQGP